MHHPPTQPESELCISFEVKQSYTFVSLILRVSQSHQGAIAISQLYAYNLKFNILDTWEPD